MGKDFTGTWHWDDARASIDACVAHLDALEQTLPKRSKARKELAAFRLELEAADSRRSDSMAVWRWGVALGRLHGFADPCAYASALTNSSAISRPSLATREGRPVEVEAESRDGSATLQERWDAMVQRSRIERGLPLAEDSL